MITVPLSQGFEALIDDEDAEAVLAHKWSVAVREGVTYAAGQPGLLHTFLTGYALTDHINGNGLDNRRSNLREATKAQNAWNAVAHRDNKSGYKGVAYHKQSGKWTATINTHGNRKYLGIYADPAEAARAYDTAAVDLHGEFARLNFPEEA